jgi:hypothetical protein
MEINELAKLWGEHYQTTQDEAKMGRFAQEMSQPANEELLKLAQLGASAFSEGETGIPSNVFNNLLYHTMYHESGAAGGTPRRTQGYLNTDTGEWVSQGPAGSYAQVEPQTLRDIVTVEHNGVLKPSTAYFGPKSAELTGFTAKQLANMSDEQLKNALANPDNQILGAVAAAAKYAKSFRNKAVNDTMDSYNKVEDIYNAPTK